MIRLLFNRTSSDWGHYNIVQIVYFALIINANQRNKHAELNIVRVTAIVSNQWKQLEAIIVFKFYALKYY